MFGKDATTYIQLAGEASIGESQEVGNKVVNIICKATGQCT
jgi:hypothetical protein